LVLDKAEHSAFGDRALPGETERRNPNHHRAILAVTTAFWDASPRNDEQARQWLGSDAVRSVLEKDDQWQKMRLCATQPQRGSVSCLCIRENL
jgi:hypothetical protein